MRTVCYGFAAALASLFLVSDDARPTPPSTYVTFDGVHAHVEVPSSAGMSVGSLGLTIAVWVRPDSLAFVNTEGSLAVRGGQAEPDR